MLLLLWTSLALLSYPVFYFWRDLRVYWLRLTKVPCASGDLRYELNISDKVNWYLAINV